MNTASGSNLSPELFQQVTAMIRQTAGFSPDEPIEAETPLLDGGLALDSVVVLELLLALEQKFDLEIDPEDLIKDKVLSTAGSLVAFIGTKTQTA